MSYELRPATPADHDWAYELKKDAYREVVERQFGPWDEEQQQQFFEGRWNPSISNIVRVDGQDVGLIAFEDRADCIWVDEIQLITGWRRRVIGSQIVSDLLAEARAKGKPLRLQVLRENKEAQRLYERLGFVQIGSSETHNVLEAV